MRSEEVLNLMQVAHCLIVNGDKKTRLFIVKDLTGGCGVADLVNMFCDALSKRNGREVPWADTIEEISEHIEAGAKEAFLLRRHEPDPPAAPTSFQPAQGLRLRNGDVLEYLTRANGRTEPDLTDHDEAFRAVKRRAKELGYSFIVPVSWDGPTPARPDIITFSFWAGKDKRPDTENVTTPWENHNG